MTKYLFLFYILAFSNVAHKAYAQSDQKVKWQYKAIKKGDKLYQIQMTATIDQGWHLYSQQQSADAIALPTTFTFVKNPLIQAKGKTSEQGKLYDEIEPATRSRSRYYTNKVVFVQEVILKKNIKTAFKGEVEFMVCDDKQCLPPGNVKFSVSLQ